MWGLLEPDKDEKGFWWQPARSAYWSPGEAGEIHMGVEPG
jgi:hypothetical protein